jgi:prepilin-type N-terminal cleavage/methylation domain-containing protein
MIRRSSRSSVQRRRNDRGADTGFTLVEVLIGIVVSAIIGGVVVGSLITSTDIAQIATDQVNDSTDAGLIAAFLTRDAQASGGVDPSTGRPDETIGVATAASGGDWSGCEQKGDFVARFSWYDRQAVDKRRSIVTTYALLDGDLTRRICQDDTTSESLLGEGISSVTATCAPDEACGPKTTSVTLDVVGGSTEQPFVFQLRAELRRDLQASVSSANAAPVPLLALGEAEETKCPVLSVQGKGAVTVLGDAMASTRCGDAPVSDDRSLLRPSGALITTPASDPLVGLSPPSFECGAGTNPEPLGASPSATAVVVYPQRVKIGGVVNFQPGQHVFCDGLDITANSAVTGRDVTLLTLGRDSNIDPSAALELSAPEKGPMANIVLWLLTSQRLSLPSSLSAGTYRGIVYGPTSTVSLDSSIGLNIGGLVANSVEVIGSGAHRIGLPIPQLALAPGELARGQANVAYPPTNFKVSGGTGPYQFSASTLPPGLRMDTAGLLSGTPTQAGTYTVFVTARDATELTQTLRLTLDINVALSVASPASLPVAQAGVAYSATFTTAGGTAPVTWSATGVPIGMSMSSSGVLSGTPTVSGPFNITATARDAAGGVATRTLPLSITAQLAISGPAALPNGQVGVDYAATAVATTGGTAPLRWSAVGLPAGLAIDATTGVISGRPTAVSATPVTITVTDARAATASTILPITITSPVPTGCPTAPRGWRGEYFSNISLTGPAALCRDDAEINFDWAGGTPDPAVRVTDNFSVRWTRTADFAAGSYLFTLGSDDGGRLYIDGVLVIDRWIDQGYPSRPPTYLANLTAGPHTIVVEYYERGGYARAVANWRAYVPVTCPATVSGWRGEYYASRDLSGPMVLCRDDARVNFNWGSGAPDPAVPADQFSVRWTRRQVFTGGTYTFRMGTDDGGRLYIDGVLVLSRWVDQSYPSSIPSVTVNLTPGEHTIVLEYFENGGVAAATLTW